MKLDLFQDAIVNRDFLEYNITKGDIVFLNDYITAPTGEEGCVVEIYTATEKFVGVAILPFDSIESI